MYHASNHVWNSCRKSYTKEIIADHVCDDMLSVLYCDLLVLLLSVKQTKCIVAEKQWINVSKDSINEYNTYRWTEVLISLHCVKQKEMHVLNYHMKMLWTTFMCIFFRPYLFWNFKSDSNSRQQNIHTSCNKFP